MKGLLNTMTSRFAEFDRSRLKTASLDDRRHDLSISAILPLNLVDFPDKPYLALAKKIAAARQQDSAVILMMGAHVLRSGVQRYLIDLMEKRYVVLIGLMAVLLVVALLFFVGVGDFWDKITGRLGSTTTVVHNITVTSGSGPVVYTVWNETMTDVSSGPTEDSATYVMINFSVSDADGYGNLNDSTAAISFNLSGATRTNTSCARVDGAGNYANYTCNVTMWWFDAPGTWSINASISDTSSNVATNTTNTFDVGTTAGFSASPSELTWADIGPGAVGVEPSGGEYILMNNTGNLIRDVEVNATNLYGEMNSAQALWAANFTSHISAGCGGTAMVADAFTQVVDASLPIGNYTLDDGTGQEGIYLCLEAANAVLDAQSYSTASAGSWTLRIFMVLLSVKRKKKRKVSRKKLMESLDCVLGELKEDGSFSEEEIGALVLERVKSQYKKKVVIPLHIFCDKLGALESLTKYMKENLGMRYSEIAAVLVRDERTVWTSYNKAKEKVRRRFGSGFELGDAKLTIPLSEFEKEGLTVLERVVVYLKDKKRKKYSEISKIIDRDQRNVWAIYSKASSKLS